MSLTDRQLFRAVEEGDCEKVKQILLDQTVDVNQAPRHQKGITPLMRACQNGDLKMITLLLENGASLESLALDGPDPLILACEVGDLEIVQFLLEKGSSSLHPISQTPKKTALSSACEKGHYEIAKFLIEKGVAIDQTKKGGESPLWICCERRDFEMANLLIDNKAKVDWATNEGETPFCCACKRGDFEMAQFLINKGANVNFSLLQRRLPNLFSLTPTSWTPLCIAVIANDIKMVRFLLEKGAQPNFLAKDQMSPWHIACQRGNLEIVKIFLERADLQIDQQGNLGKTALFEAIQGGLFDVIALLVERGASVNFTSHHLSMTAFHAACQLGDLKIVSFLTQHGARLQVARSDGLLIALKNDHMAVVSYLLENMQQELNVGPLCFASQEGRLDLAKFFISKKCPINGVHSQFYDQSPLTLACINNNLDIAELLLQNGAHLIVQEQSVLHQLCSSSSVTLPAVKILVENGADVNGMYHNTTPLVAILQHSQKIPGEIILFFLKNGLQVDKTNSPYQETVLHLAVKRDFLEVVKLLCEHGGCDPGIKNIFGQTPADCASQPVKDFLEEYVHSGGSIKPAKRDGKTKIESSGKEEEKVKENREK